MKDLLSSVEKAVKEAGKLFKDSSLYNEHIIKEGAANFVTQVDLSVQDFLVKELQRILPGSNIITEESQDNSFSLEKPTWILDPVDGTTNLMHQYMHSAVSLALLVEGELTLGVIYNPYSGEMFTGVSKEGAFLNNVPIKVSSSKSLDTSLLCFGTTPYDREKAQADFQILSGIFMHCQDLRRTGSAALDLAYVASGRIEGFFERCLQPWDFAAGALILKEAGGEITDYNGDKLNMLKPQGVVATNGLIHKELLGKLE